MEFKFVSHKDEVLRAFREQLELGMEAVGLEATRYAAEDCPVDTGLLRNSIAYAVSGKGANKTSYHAKYGSNFDSKGNRISASSEKAGSVGFGMYSGTIGDSGENAIYIGTNVEYAPYVEFNDNVTHQSGKAHFLRDAATTHSEQYKQMILTALK